jgi:hypothetical protein
MLASLLEAGKFRLRSRRLHPDRPLPGTLNNYALRFYYRDARHSQAALSGSKPMPEARAFPVGEGRIVKQIQQGNLSRSESVQMFLVTTEHGIASNNLLVGRGGKQRGKPSLIADHS